MKVLVLTTCYPRRTLPMFGRFIHRQVRALVDLGADCQVLQPVDWAPPPPLDRLLPGWRRSRILRRDLVDEIDGVPVHHPVAVHPKPSRFFPGDYWTRVGEAVRRYVERRPALRRADVLYAHFLCHEGYAGLVAARALRMPLVAIARGDDVHAWPRRWPDRHEKLAAVLAGAQGLLACSPGLARDAQGFAIRGLARPIEVLYNGVDGRRFEPVTGEPARLAARRRFGLAGEDCLLLSVGPPTVAKGWSDVLDAMASLGPRAAGWTLVGAGLARDEGNLDLEAMARARGLGDRMRWLGAVVPGDMPDLYQACDAFVLASHGEGLSNALVEAMATGLPVVATEVGGHGDVIDDGISGRLVPPHDIAALTEALGSVLGDLAHARRLGGAARGRALALGDAPANARRLLSYLEEVVASSGARGVVPRTSPSFNGGRA